MKWTYPFDPKTSKLTFDPYNAELFIHVRRVNDVTQGQIMGFKKPACTDVKEALLKFPTRAA